MTRTRLFLFLFLWSSLLLPTRASFWRPDGYIQYEVARRILAAGALDLPHYRHIRDFRVRHGLEGKFYSRFGLGSLC